MGVDGFSNSARLKFSGIFLSPFISAFKLPVLPFLLCFVIPCQMQEDATNAQLDVYTSRASDFISS